MIVWQVLVFVAMFTLGVHSNGCSTHHGSFPWKPDWLPQRGDLYCDNKCINKLSDTPFQLDSSINEKDACCTCNSCTNMVENSVDLYIEYTSVTRKSLVFSDKPFDNNTFYQIRHTYDVMTSIPSNLCPVALEADYVNRYTNQMNSMEEFMDNIVTIRLDYNFILELPNLSCLSRLDTLSLKHNNINYITNTSISNLTYLRVLDISENKIKGMDPGVLFSPHLNIFIANFSDNHLTQLDVTNVFLPEPFCKVQYENNKIAEILNVAGFKLGSLGHGPGLVSLANNALEVFPDLKTLLGMDSLSQWGQLISWGFDLRGIKLNCNCHLEPFMFLAQEAKKTLWRDYFDVRCVNPPDLFNRRVIDLDPIELVCELDKRAGCPDNCTCVDRPALSTVFVDCSNRQFYELPEYLPKSTFSEFIALNVSRNNIPHILNRSYLEDVIELDLSMNHLNHFDEDIAGLLEDTVLNISKNRRLRQIPQEFQFRNICDTVMDYDILDCNCNNLWLDSWVHTKASPSCKPLFSCDVQGKGTIPVADFKRSLLNCTPLEDTLTFVIASIIAACILFLIVLGVLLYNWNYEILIIWTRIKQRSLTERVMSLKHDVTISLNEEDDKLRLWVKDKLLPVLGFHGYRAFLPYRDLPYGSERDQEMSETISDSRTFLLVLSESYLTKSEDCTNGRSWTENEWKYGWHRFLANPDHNLVIVNYDYVSPSAVHHPQIKAFLRVGHVVDFFNFNNRVLVNIRRKIGAPGSDDVTPLKEEKNINVRFRPRSAQTPNLHQIKLLNLLGRRSNADATMATDLDLRTIPSRAGLHVGNQYPEQFILPSNITGGTGRLPWHRPVRPLGPLE